ncbi:F390 synthetase-related protein [Bartonella sp. LJL80]
MLNQIYAVNAFIRTKRLYKKLRSRADVDAWQKRKLENWLLKSVAGVSFYQGARYQVLDDLPIINKQIMMESFSAFNQSRISLDDVRASIVGNGSIAKMHCGMSTGTSGNRTYYIISDRERFVWLGTMLGKLLPSYPKTSARIAVALPMETPLYQSANHLWRLELRFFNLNDGVEQVVDNINHYQPDSLIAPPHLLRYLAHANVNLPLKRLFSAGEVLDPFDRGIISSHFSVRVDEIYMASEGLLATPCCHGGLHLCEDVMHFSLEKEGSNGLVSPVITDFSRNTQIMARYRLNDLLRMDEQPCPCGSPYMLVSEIVGRKDDSFQLQCEDGKVVILTPDILRNAIIDSSPQITDFRLLHRADGTVELQLPPHYSAEIYAGAIEKLQAMFSGFGVLRNIKLGVLESSNREGKKLRRIENQYGPVQ